MAFELKIESSGSGVHRPGLKSQVQLGRHYDLGNLLNYFEPYFVICKVEDNTIYILMNYGKD